MAVDPLRAEIEHIKCVVKVYTFDLTGYTILPDVITITLKKNIKTIEKVERELASERISTLLATYGWYVTTMTIVADELVVTAEKRRTLTRVM